MLKFLPYLLIPVSGAVFLALFPVHVLSLHQEGRLIFMERIRPGNSFSLTYLHSVEKSDVWERFVVDAEYRMVLTETRFQGQGAGLPSSLAPGEIITREGQWFQISGMARVLPSIHLRVDPQWQNRFRFENQEEKDLSRIAGNSLVLIRVEKISLFRWLESKVREMLAGKALN